MQPLLLVLGLGIAGLDPWGLAVLLAAVAAGANKAEIVAFSLSTLIGAVVLGCVTAVFGKLILDQISTYLPALDDPVWAIVELVVAAVLAYWVISERTGAKPDTEEPDAPAAPKASVLGMAASGFAFSVATILDPTFFAAAAIASQAPNAAAMVGLLALWVLVSQAPLFAFATAFLFDAHEPLMAFVTAYWEKIKGPVMWIIRALAALAAVLLTADAMTLFATGAYLLPL